MDPAFRRRTELGVKLAFLAVAGLVGVALLLLVWRDRSYEPIGEPVSQPIPFSHKHHVGDDGLDCRYCHATVETSARAGLPGTAVCMGCHAQLYKDQPLLAALRESQASGRPVPWQQVHQLPGFVYFDHHVHVNNGVACVECHGRVDQMPLTWRAQPMQMQWCLACHRNPAPHLHPRSQVFRMDTLPPTADEARSLAALLREHDRPRLTQCSTCHR